MNDEAFAYVLYVYLSVIPEMNLTLDDWKTLRIVSETPDSLHAVGVMYVLPPGELPMEVKVSKEHDSITYVLRTGVADERWNSLSESKRWKAVYHYALGERDAAWNWSEPLSGRSAY